MRTKNEHTKNSLETQTESQLISITMVMDRLQVSRTTVYRLTKEGKLPSLKIRKCVRYKSGDVEKLLKDIIEADSLAKL